MNKKESTSNKVSMTNLSHKPVENDANSNHESFIIPNEAACSPEFPGGCIVLEDED